MTDNKAINEISTENKAGLVVFKRSYTFEGKEYKEIDLSGAQDLTGAQYCKIERNFERGGNFSALKELNTSYIFMIASEVTGLPLEFFNNLRGSDIVQVRNAISSYFFDQGSELAEPKI